MPMEERPPPSAAAGDAPPFPPPPKSAGETPPLRPPPSKSAALAVGGENATYVVHFPRDQIYRVPPPEHAKIIENHLSLKRRRPDNSRRKKIICCLVVPIVLIPLILAGVWVALRHTIYEPAPPDVAFSRVHGQNLDAKKPPEYDVTLRVTNRKKQMSVAFGGGAGEASLAYKTQVIGKGKMGSGGGGGAFTDAADVPVVLSGNGVSLAAGVKKALSGAAENTMAFDAEFPMEMKSWARNEKKDLKISCDIKVQNLFNKTKISFQECVSKF